MAATGLRGDNLKVRNIVPGYSEKAGRCHARFGEQGDQHQHMKAANAANRAEIAMECATP